MPGFLVEYHRRSGLVNMTQFDSLSAATLERLELDAKNQDPDLEIVSISSRSEEHLRTSHSRYFSVA